MAHKPVGASRHQTPQGREDPEPSAQAEKAGEAKTRSECHEEESARGPGRVAGNPSKIRHLGLGVGIRYDDGSAGRE